MFYTTAPRHLVRATFARATFRISSFISLHAKECIQKSLARTSFVFQKDQPLVPRWRWSAYMPSTPTMNYAHIICLNCNIRHNYCTCRSLKLQPKQPSITMPTRWNHSSMHGRGAIIWNEHLCWLNAPSFDVVDKDKRRIQTTCEASQAMLKNIDFKTNKIIDNYTEASSCHDQKLFLRKIKRREITVWPDDYIIFQYRAI